MVEHLYKYEGKFYPEAGGAIDGLSLVYHTSPGECGGRKVVWICHALTANSDPEDWWNSLVGPGKLIDTGKYFVVCVNMVGSCYGSTGPSSINPATGKPYFLDFPRITVRDIARTLDLVREHLGIGTIDFILGSSIGGFQAIEYCIMFPDKVKNALFMATTARISPWMTAFEETQRMAVEADPTFFEQKDLDGGKTGMKCARAIGLISYRSYEGYNRTQLEPGADTIFPSRACSYQRYQGEKLAKRFDAYSYWYLSHSVDSQNAGRGRGGVEAALGRIKARITVVAIDSDLIFPPEEVGMMSKALAVPLKTISSKFGHDGFLLETEQITAILQPILNEL